MRIALLMDQGSSYGRAAFAGVRRRLLPRLDCRLLVAEPRIEAWSGMVAAGADAAIVHANDPALVAAVRGWGRPAVAFGGYDAGGLPHSGVDDQAVGRLAGEFLIPRGARSFVCIGRTASLYTRLRYDGFAAALAAAGRRATWMEWDEDPRRMVAALARRPRPVGLLVGAEETALRIVAACTDAGLAIPGHVQVISGTDDPVICTLARPTISAVRFDAERIGDEAAGMLLALAAGAAPPAAPLRIRPSQVVERASTARAAGDDPEVAAALAWLQGHAHEWIGVDDVVRAVGSGRRRLERRFAALVGRSIYQHLMALRLDLAKARLRVGDEPLAEVAAACGFAGARHLCETFRQREGTSPGAYRAAAR
jgi:LacI family transcriptional regulator